MTRSTLSLRTSSWHWKSNRTSFPKRLRPCKAVTSLGSRSSYFYLTGILAVMHQYWLVVVFKPIFLYQTCSAPMFCQSSLFELTLHHCQCQRPDLLLSFPPLLLTIISILFTIFLSHQCLHHLPLMFLFIFRSPTLSILSSPSIIPLLPG